MAAILICPLRHASLFLNHPSFTLAIVGDDLEREYIAEESSQRKCHMMPRCHTALTDQKTNSRSDEYYGMPGRYEVPARIILPHKSRPEWGLAELYC